MRKSNAKRWCFAGRMKVMAGLITMLALAAAAGGTFDLHIDDVVRLDEPWPFIGGLPFAAGELRDAEQIRIVDEGGAEIPAQIDLAATWRDGSIRWALAGFTAIPKGRYRVEYGRDIRRSPPTHPLKAVNRDDGAIVVDTGEAVYEFSPDGLLPATVRMGNTTLMSDAGAGAYLVDNHGRMARAAGARAEIETTLIKSGPLRVVVRREGWYVTADGERVARAKAWFYLSAGSPWLRITHSLIFTEDTNELWVRDYGLEFSTPDAPRRALFAWGAPGLTPADLRLMQPVAPAEILTASMTDDELYMLQDTYPHFREVEARAVLARAPVAADRAAAVSENYWMHDWLHGAAATGDWAAGCWDEYSLTVVMPWMAQRFPKEIGFGPDGVRAVFWSGRSGRELDFRALTLVNEYWRRWAELSGERADRGPVAATKLAQMPSNAQCAARTHDIWLMPAKAPADEQLIAARAAAASRPPLMLADPVRICATESMGWPMHPRDADGFARAEEVIEAFWQGILNHYETLRLAGFIAWGGNPFIRSIGATHFRITNLVDYGLRGHVWGLYARSGERTYYDYGSRFNRFAADWFVAHADAGAKFKGGFVSGNSNLPFYWGESGFLRGGVTGHDILHWLSEYYLLGDEYSAEIVDMISEAFKTHYDDRLAPAYDGAQGTLGVIVNLYRHTWDEKLGQLARWYVDYLIDLDHPFGLNDDVRFGMYYKVGRKLVALRDYYEATGDERAREAFLRAVDYKFRLYQTLNDTSMGGSRGAFGGQNYMTYIFSIAWQWTHNPAYLRMVKRLIDDHAAASLDDPDRPAGIGAAMLVHHQMNPFKGAPAGMAVLAGVDEPIEQFPTLMLTEPRPLLMRKNTGQPVRLSIYVKVADQHDANFEPQALISMPDRGPAAPPDVKVTKEQMAPTQGTRQDPRRWHFHLAWPADASAGDYRIEFPDAGTIVVLESDAPALE